MIDDDIIMIGAGGHAKVVINTLIQLNIGIKCIYDDDNEKWGQSLCGVEIAGPISDLIYSVKRRAVMAIGDNQTRKKFANRFENYDWITVIHPRATVHPSVCIGEGTVVFAGAVIQPDTIIGNHCIVNTNASIDHDCIVEDYAHIGPGSCLAGNVKVGEGAFFGIGSVAIMGSAIGRWSTVGAGAAVIHDIPDNVTAVGLPARVIKSKEEA